MINKNGVYLKIMNYDNCRNDALKCKTLKEFRTSYEYSYKIARKNGWLEGFNWLSRNKMTSGYWNYERCYEEAKKYSKRKQLQVGMPTVYRKALKNKWLDDYTWFSHNEKVQKWTYETCYEVAKLYESRKELGEKNQRVYQVALKHKWLDDYTWFKSTKELLSRKHPNRVKWTYEICIGLAKKCTTLNEFIKKHKLAYDAAKRNGWVKDYSWLQRYGKSKITRTDNVYAYVFLGTKCVYVGRSVEPERRNKSHHNNDSSVYKFAKKNSLPIPRMQILESGLSVEDGVIREDYWVHYFIDRGFYVINKAKTGKDSGSMGGLGYGKWDYEKCYNVALKYKSVRELKKNCQYVYAKALKEGFVKDFYWLYNKKEGA